jgi:hypothetical protein
MHQWVLSMPFPLRFLFASQPKIKGKALGIVNRCPLYSESSHIEPAERMSADNPLDEVACDKTTSPTHEVLIGIACFPCVFHNGHYLALSRSTMKIVVNAEQGFDEAKGLETTHS